MLDYMVSLVLTLHLPFRKSEHASISPGNVDPDMSETSSLNWLTVNVYFNSIPLAHRQPVAFPGTDQIFGESHLMLHARAPTRNV